MLQSHLEGARAAPGDPALGRVPHRRRLDRRDGGAPARMDRLLRRDRAPRPGAGRAFHDRQGPAGARRCADRAAAPGDRRAIVRCVVGTLRRAQGDARAGEHLCRLPGPRAGARRGRGQSGEPSGNGTTVRAAEPDRPAAVRTARRTPARRRSASAPRRSCASTGYNDDEIAALAVRGVVRSRWPRVTGRRCTVPTTYGGKAMPPGA